MLLSETRQFNFDELIICVLFYISQLLPPYCLEGCKLPDFSASSNSAISGSPIKDSLLTGYMTVLQTFRTISLTYLRHECTCMGMSFSQWGPPHGRRVGNRQLRPRNLKWWGNPQGPNTSCLVTSHVRAVNIFSINVGFRSSNLEILFRKRKLCKLTRRFFILLHYSVSLFHLNSQTFTNEAFLPITTHFQNFLLHSLSS